jgi:hypothetical protein
MRIAWSAEGRDYAFEKAVGKKEHGNKHPSADECDADFKDADIPLAAKVEFENVLDGKHCPALANEKSHGCEPRPLESWIRQSQGYSVEVSKCKMQIGA